MATQEGSNLLRAFPHLPEKRKAAIESILQRGALLRQQILESFPTQETGINVERLFDFFKSYNLRICPFIFIKDKTEFQKFTNQYEQAKVFFPPDLKEGEWLAFYDPEIDLIVVNADSDFEAQSSLDKEWDLAHEEAHASCKHGGCKLVEGRVFRPRLGFSVGINKESNIGEFLEEGFAEWMASMYRSRYVDQKTLQRFDKFVEGSPKDLNFMVEFEIDNLSLPAKYLTFDKDGDLTDIPENAFPAYAFQVIAENRPNFLSTTIEARSSPAMLAKMIREINTVAPDLYSKIHKLQYNAEDFRRGLMIILDAVKNTYN